MNHKPTLTFIKVGKYSALSDTECLICDETYFTHQTLQTDCGHKICIECAEVWLKSNIFGCVCPICNKPTEKIFIKYSNIQATNATDMKTNYSLQNISPFCKIRK